MPELRKDPIVNRWVIISTERSKRPQDFPSPVKKTRKGTCPFCTGNEATTPPEIFALRPPDSPANSPGWSLRVVPNKFPALRIEGDMQATTDGLFEKRNGIGAHEVIVESPEHALDLDQLSLSGFTDCLKAYQSRILDLKQDSRFQYVLIFKNHGEAAGATLEHTHSQLIALPIVPDLVHEEIAGATRHFDEKEQCIFCHLIEQEIRDGQRIVAQNETFISLCPYAPRFPFEMWILPRFHAAHFESGDPEVLERLAAIFKESLSRMRIALDAPPYNFFLHTAPLTGQYEHRFHWHFEIMPKLTKMAGFEQGTGFYINPVLPEAAAETLRNVQL